MALNNLVLFPNLSCAVQWAHCIEQTAPGSKMQIYLQWQSLLCIVSFQFQSRDKWWLLNADHDNGARGRTRVGGVNWRPSYAHPLLFSSNICSALEDHQSALLTWSILLSDVFFSRDYRCVASRMILFSQTPTCQFPNAQHGLHMGD